LPLWTLPVQFSYSAPRVFDNGSAASIASRPVFALARFIGSASNLIEIRMEPAYEPTAGGNNVILHLTLDGVRLTSARAALIQATDTMEYDCEDVPVDYEYDFCQRTLPATGGTLRLKSFLLEAPCDAVLAGSFEFDTEAGRVSGTFVAEGVARGR